MKIGGSIATDPGATDRVHGSRIRALAAVVVDAIDAGRVGPGVVIVHGTGHVGKPAAIQHGFHRTGRLEAARRNIALAIKNDLADLNTRVTAHLLAAGLPAVAIHAEDALPVEAGRTPTAPHRLIDAIDAGLVPVLYGDMVQAQHGAWRVLSSDEIIVHLADLLRPRITAFLSDVDGVLAIDRETGREVLLTELTPKDDDRVAKRASDERDVSGGMSAKIETARRAAGCSGTCHILSGTHPERLRDLVGGLDTTSTRIAMAVTSRAPAPDEAT